MENEDQIVQEFIRRNECSAAEAKRRLLQLGIRTYGAVLAMSSAGLEQQSPSAVPGAAILTDKLERLGVNVLGIHSGRPTTVRIQARNPLTGAWPSVLQLRDGPTTAALVYCARRSRGSAQFTVGSFTGGGRGSIANPQVFFFVLEEERRVWALTRRHLVETLAKLEGGGSVTGMALGRRKGTLRVILPSKLVDADLVC